MLGRSPRTLALTFGGRLFVARSLVQLYRATAAHSGRGFMKRDQRDQANLVQPLDFFRVRFPLL